MVATPDKRCSADRALAEWEKEESEREDRARANGGAYYPPTALQDAYDRLVTAVWRRTNCAPRWPTCRASCTPSGATHWCRG